MADFRSTRTKLSPAAFAISEGMDAALTDLIPEETEAAARSRFWTLLRSKPSAAGGLVGDFRVRWVFPHMMDSLAGHWRTRARWGEGGAFFVGPG
jgi:hypothetical protein